MPGQFTNTSNSGGVTFINNSNSGQAIFTFSAPTSSLFNATLDTSGYNNSTDACNLGNPTTPIWASTLNPTTAIFYSDSTGTTLASTTYSLADGNYRKILLNSIYYVGIFAVDSTFGNVAPC